MARAFGVKTIRTTIAAANTPQVISATPLFTDAFRVMAGKNNVGSIAIGDSTVTVLSSAATDGEPLLKTEGMDVDVIVKGTSLTAEINLNVVYVVGTNKDDEVIITYLQKVS